MDCWPDLCAGLSPYMFVALWPVVSAERKRRHRPLPSNAGTSKAKGQQLLWFRGPFQSATPRLRLVPDLPEANY